MRHGVGLGLIAVILLGFGNIGNAQDVGQFSGQLSMQNLLFLEDADIGATNIPQYDYQKIGTQAWFDLKYQYKGYELGIRLDLFNNSNLKNPNQSYNGLGIGKWYARKKINRLDITAGYIYDQIGSGIIYRSYVARPLFIDNALEGLRLEFDISDEWQIVGFAGKQKNEFTYFEANLKGLYTEGYIDFGEGKPKLAPGIGMTNRTYSDATIDAMIDIASSYSLEADKNQIHLKYNTYAYSLYNRFTAGAFSWYIEGALKTIDTSFDPFESFSNFSGDEILGQYVSKKGNVLYTSLTYAKSGLGITLEGKRTEFFDYRIDPRLIGIQGLINFLPPMNRNNTYRLTSRYAPAVQPLGELAFQGDLKYRFSKKWRASINGSYITDLDDQLLYSEIYTDVSYKNPGKWSILGGLQLVEYNQEVYETKPNVPNVKTIVPFMEFQYKFSRRKNLRIEAQYMNTKEDYGSWIFALAEFSLSPHWIFTVSDMYNVDPKKKINGELKALHYPTVSAVYSYKNNRFTLSYVKQVEGIVCSGGICRLEPAFSGFQLGINSNF